MKFWLSGSGGPVGWLCALVVDCFHSRGAFSCGKRGPTEKVEQVDFWFGGLDGEFRNDLGA